MSETLEDVVGNEIGRKAYEEWIRDPFTMRMLSAARTGLRPISVLISADERTAANVAWHLQGAHDILDVIENAAVAVVTLSDIPYTYGASELLEKSARLRSVSNEG